LKYFGDTEFSLAPLKFETCKFSFTIFYQINFLLLVRSPKVHIHSSILITVQLHSFAEHEIFPEYSCVLAERHRVEIIYQGVANPGIVNLPLLVPQ
jgi:hypothetical protein